MATTREAAAAPAALTLELDGDGVAWLTFDRPESRVNLLTTAVMERLDGLLAEVEEAVRIGRAKGLVIRSTKPGVFIAGADIGEIAAIVDPREAEAKARDGQRVFRRLEQLPIPTIAVIDGVCMGGGTELALACAYRLATDRPETKIALPEVRLGIIPGFGGTTRLPRLIGPRAALELIVTGKSVSARRAERLGLVDEVLPSAGFDERIRRFTWERIDRGRLRPIRRRSFLDRFLEDTAPGRMVLFRQARQQVLRETGGHYPAPLAAINTIAASLPLPLDEAFEREAHATGRLVATEVSKNLIHVYNLMEGAKKSAPAAEARAVEHAAVLGAGVMGGGIAQLLAYRGISTRLKDIRTDAIAAGLRHARGLFDRSVRRKRLSRLEADQAMSRISPTLDFSGFGVADVVIEAVVERLDVKKAVLREAEAQVQQGTVLASNTSTLSITEMQHALDIPERCCGMHFFNPVDRMPLVEVIRGAATSDEALATVFKLALRLGKTPVLVEDRPGFLVNRLLAPYLNEAGWLLAEGASIEAVDRALREFGMPMGPFRLLDEVGLDISRHASAILYEAFGDRMSPAEPLLRLAETTRLGRKGGRGFYRYQDGKEKGVDNEIYAELDDAVPAQRVEFAADLIRERTILAMVNEAARALEEEVVRGPGDVDLAMITGTGFPPFRGGLLRYADSLGTPVLLEKLLVLEEAHGVRFQPAPLLRELARSGQGFYARKS
jgi:3-hydroxyacyl-CoA dehydrogenase/enoyl-CoA hydratase/3-hydroxybutyryl-CoA epimerase